MICKIIYREISTLHKVTQNSTSYETLFPSGSEMNNVYTTDNRLFWRHLEPTIFDLGL